MRDKKYYQPGYISEWVVINYTNERGVEQMMKGLVECCNTRGISPLLDHVNARDDFVGMFRRRGVKETGETGRLHLPRVIPGNPQVVEVRSPTDEVCRSH